MIEQEWRVRLGAAAELDFVNLVAWTTENFGARQSRIYRDRLVRAIGELASGPDVAGSKAVTRSCRASACSILPGTAGVDVISSYTGSAKRKSLKSAVSYMNSWTYTVRGQPIPEARILATCPP
jgi:toxin ParE1/3/4